MNRRKKGGFAAGCCVALLLITLCAAAGGGVLWYVGRTMAQPGSASMQGASGALGGGAEDAGRQEPLFREGDTVDTVLAKMTLAEKVGQMFIVRCPEQGAAEKAAEYHLGGYILFRENFEEKTPVQAAEMVRACQAAAALPMLVGVDEEGGTVNRISGYPAFRDTPFASPQELYQAGGFDAVREDALEKCAFLEKLGVNVNFAPVCDVSTDPEDFIYKRSFGRNAAETAQYVRTVVEAMGERGMGSVLKHFPGYCALPGFVDSKNEEKTERNAGYLVVSHSGGGMLRQGTRKGIRRTPANRGMRAHRIVKSLDISEDVCHGLCP